MSQIPAIHRLLNLHFGTSLTCDGVHCHPLKPTSYVNPIGPDFSQSFRLTSRGPARFLESTACHAKQRRITHWFDKMPAFERNQPPHKE